MKKILYSAMIIVALLAWGCEKETNSDNPNDTTGTVERKPDITPYLGKYLLTRTTDLSITIQNMFTIPINRDLDAETLTIAADPTVEYGVILTSTDGMFLHGTVDTVGLHLEDEIYTISVDTTVASIPFNAEISASLTHPLIPAPVDGVLDWTSVASGTVSLAVPILGTLTGTITGEMRYRSVFQSK